MRYIQIKIGETYEYQIDDPTKNWLRNCGSCEAIPIELMMLPDAKIAGLLGGLYDADNGYCIGSYRMQ